MAHEITDEERAALHGYVNQAEELARYIRLVSGGALTLAVCENVYVSQAKRDAAHVVGLGMEAHDYATQIPGRQGGSPGLGAVQQLERTKEAAEDAEH